MNQPSVKLESISAAARALDHFRKGLIEGGYLEALPTYAAMTDTIMAQRLLMPSPSSEELEAEFAAISSTAADIAAIFEAWRKLMLRLSALNAVSDSVLSELLSQQLAHRSASAGVAQLDAGEAAVLEWLATHPGPQPASRLTAAVALPEGTEPALARLESLGVIRSSQSGHRLRWEAVQTVEQ